MKIKVRALPILVAMFMLVGVLGSCNVGKHSSFYKILTIPSKGPGEQRNSSAEEGRPLTQNYRRIRSDEPYATNFKEDFLIKIMEEKGCVGLRFYQIVSLKNGLGLMVVGIDSTGNDIITKVDDPAQKAPIAISYDKCPENCDTQNSPLNEK